MLYKNRNEYRSRQYQRSCFNFNHGAVEVDVNQLLTNLIFRYSKLRDVILKQDCSCIKDKYLR